MSASNVRNQGIAHLSPVIGGPPVCGTKHYHISTTTEHLNEWPMICAKCLDLLGKMRLRDSKAAGIRSKP